MHAPSSSLFDQTALAERAERLVKAARAPAPMPPTRSRCAGMSLSIEVRDGAVEESERAEGDDLGLRVLVGRRQAVVSTNDIVGRRQRARSPNARSPWRAPRRRTNIAGLADREPAGA